ncbi:MAG: hypothetical protein WD940_00530 [Patescibacteria group bacterium]
MDKIPSLIRILILSVLGILGSLGLGFALEQIFAAGIVFDLFLGIRFVVLLAFFFLTAAFFTVVSLTAPTAVRLGGMVLAALAFGLPFVILPNPVGIPVAFSGVISLAYLGALLFLGYISQYTVKIHAAFNARMFSSAFSRFFQVFTIVVGVLVYFSSAPPSPANFTIPEGLLAPALNLVVNQVISEVQGQLGNTQFTEEKFLTELEKTGFLKVLEQQYGIVLDPEDISTPKELAESLRQPLTEELTRNLKGYIEPYLPLLPLATALGAALSLLFLTPVFTWSSVGFFALVYRVLVGLRFARFDPEMREVPVLKIV